jgi:hypothetical protein
MRKTLFVFPLSVFFAACGTETATPAGGNAGATDTGSIDTGSGDTGGAWSGMNFGAIGGLSNGLPDGSAYDALKDMLPN